MGATTHGIIYPDPSDVPSRSALETLAESVETALTSTVRAGAISTTSDATGQVTVTHGGSTIPKSIQLSGRNSGWEVYLIALTATTFTVKMLGRSSGTAPTTATAVAFDWACFF